MNLLMISLPNPSLERERSGEESEEAVREKRERQEREREGGGRRDGGNCIHEACARDKRERNNWGDCTHCMHNYINAYCTCTYLLAQLMRAYLCT